VRCSDLNVGSERSKRFVDTYPVRTDTRGSKRGRDSQGKPRRCFTLGDSSRVTRRELAQPFAFESGTDKSLRRGTSRRDEKQSYRKAEEKPGHGRKCTTRRFEICSGCEGARSVRTRFHGALRDRRLAWASVHE
jgi:hypothetical protein